MNVKQFFADRPIRVEKRSQIKFWTLPVAYLCAIGAALIIGAVILSALKVEVGVYFKQLFSLGLMDNVYPYKTIENYIKLFVPLLITSLALALAFRLRFWNIGGEGQFIIGALTASAIALLISPDMSSGVVIFLMVFGGGLSAGIYGLLVAVLKVKFGTNETLLTLMLNYVALYLLKFFGETKFAGNIFLKEDSVRPVFELFGKNAWMPGIPMGQFVLNVSLIIGLILVALFWIYLKHTKQGYEIAVVGDSPNTARYAGMKTGWIIIRTVFLSAFLIGIAAAFKVSTSHTLSTSITNDVGWTGIIVAWIAKLNPLGILAAVALISYMQLGCQVAATGFSSIDANFSDLLLGIILFLVLAADFFVRYRVVIKTANRSKKKNAINADALASETSEAETSVEPTGEGIG